MSDAAYDDILRRVPPQNLEAEQAAIGAVIIHNELFDSVAELLTGDDFYREAHRRLWSGIEALAAARRPVDIVTLKDALKPEWEAIGGSSYIAEIVASTPAPSMACHYARIVREKSIQRALATAAGEIAGSAYDSPTEWNPEHIEEVLATAEYSIAQVASRAIRKPERTKSETLSNVLWRIEHGEADGIPTGFDTLDRPFGGFNIGHLTILGARTSRGKTAFATNVAINAAKAGFATAFFTLEQTDEEMLTRALGCIAQVDMFTARRRGYRNGEKERVDQARALLESLPLEILYRPSMRPRDLRIECRRLAREMGSLKLVIVDYFNLMRGDRRERERWREMQEAILGLKAIAGELGIPILLLSQLNRETNEDAPPMLANLRDTGAAEEHASNVLFIWQKPGEKDAAPAFDEWEEVEIIIAKQRNGPAGLRVPMELKKRCGAFATK